MGAAMLYGSVHGVTLGHVLGKPISLIMYDALWLFGGAGNSITAIWVRIHQH